MLKNTLEVRDRMACCILCGHCDDEVIAEMMGCQCKCHYPDSNK